MAVNGDEERGKRVSMAGLLSSLFSEMDMAGNSTSIGIDESSLPEVLRIMKRATNNVYMVTGELDPDLYEEPSFIKTLDKSVVRNHVHYHFVFHKDDDNFEEAKKIFLEENPSLVSIAKKAPEKISLYWAKSRPKLHYAVGDDRDVFFEDEHEAYEKRRARAHFNSSLLAKHFSAKFVELTHGDLCIPFSVRD